MEAPCVLSVELKQCSPERMRASKLWRPGEATVTWSDWRVDEVALRFLEHGLARDCFLVHPCHRYVLKIEAICNQVHPSLGYVLRSNEQEAHLASSLLGQCTPTVLGCVSSQWEGKQVSVLVMERIPHDFASLLSEVILHDPEEEWLGAALGVIREFVGLVAIAAGQLEYCLADLRWKNIGVAADGRLVLLKFKSCKHGPQHGPRQRWVQGVQLWLEDLVSFAAQLPVQSRWHAPMQAIACFPVAWRPQFFQQLPSIQDIDVMTAKLWDAAQVAVAGEGRARY